MTKATVIQWAGLNIDNNLFVWHYPKKENKDFKYSLGGRPMNLAECMFAAIQNGNLIPADCLDNIIELARNPEYSTEAIKELVKEYCKNV